jgi:hypothetical protein
MSCLGVSIDGSSLVSLKLFPVVIKYFHKVCGIKSKLTDLNSTLNVKLETIANCDTQALKDVAFLQSVLQFPLTTRALILDESIVLEIKMSSKL